MASPSMGQDGVGRREPGSDIVTGAGPERAELVHAAPSRQGLVSPREGPEEVAVCDLCGLVSRLPRPPVCPACGGAYG
jgi:hypothetical protein